MQNLRMNSKTRAIISLFMILSAFLACERRAYILTKSPVLRKQSPAYLEARILHKLQSVAMSREGDLVTLTDKHDISKALEELVTTADKLLGSSHSGRNTLQQMLPPLRLQLVPVDSPEVCSTRE